jgi:hypothetical protein
MDEHDDALAEALAETIRWVGPERAATTPFVSFDADCFPDPWEPTLHGVGVALQRFMRHAGLPDVPVVLDDDREGYESVGPVEYPVVFDCIEDGAARFVVLAINEPQHLAAWMALEVVRAWAEYRGVTRNEPLAYRALFPAEPDADDEAVDEHDDDEEGVLDAASATFLGITLGFGPVLAAGAIQSHKQEQINGGWVQTRWSRAVVGGLPPPLLARVLAMHAAALEANEAEIERIRRGFDADLRRDLDRCHDELRTNAAALRGTLGLPAEPMPRRALDLGPLLPLDEDARRALAEAEQANALERQMFNRGRNVYRVIHHHAIGGGVVGSLAGLAGALLAGAAEGALVVVVVGAVVGIGLGGWRRFHRCSDPDCARRVSLDDVTCPGCHGTIAGTIRRAADRLALDEADPPSRS